MFAAREQVQESILRLFVFAMVATVAVFLVNNTLIMTFGWPGPSAAFGLSPDDPGSGADSPLLAWLQLGLYPLAVVAAGGFTIARRGGLRADSALLQATSAYIVRAAFWAVLLVGFADALISFLRVEGFLEQFIGTSLTQDLSLSRHRGTFIHIPLIVMALVIAGRSRSLGFIWLVVLVVLAELQIVVARFVFSYEQAFMGDLVRFWYAALFLFASAYTLVKDGHVRVDVLYSGYSRRGKAWANLVGSLVLGVPLCWVILTLGMRGKASIINSPMLSFEVTQAGFGMFVKYLMAGFLAIFAVSMMIQFLAYVLTSAAELHESGPSDHRDRPEAATGA